MRDFGCAPPNRLHHLTTAHFQMGACQSATASLLSPSQCAERLRQCPPPPAVRVPLLSAHAPGQRHTESDHEGPFCCLGVCTSQQNVNAFSPPRSWAKGEASAVIYTTCSLIDIAIKPAMSIQRKERNI